MLSYDLHDATEEMHLRAIQVMQQLGWTRTIPAAPGSGATTAIPLPQTTFWTWTAYPASQVADAIWNALATARLSPKRVSVCTRGDVAARANA